MIGFFTIGAVVVIAVAALVGRALKSKNIDIILRASLRGRVERSTQTTHLFFCVADHFEPFWQGADEGTARARVGRWVEGYASAIGAFRDAGGRAPQHTFFYPQEEYERGCLEGLSELVQRGFGDVEIHLHHDRDTSDGLRRKLLEFKSVLHDRHGLLRKDAARGGDVTYGFIHGNWALDDSGVDGEWCGVRDEISILKETGCYGDFTYPSAPHPTQPPIINRIYYATDDPLRACSHHRGVDAAFSSDPKGDLLLINGPLGINWRQRRRGWLPAVENGDITGNNLPTPDRVKCWVDARISVGGCPQWVFVKVHTHGAQEANSNVFLGDGIATLHKTLLGRFNDGKRYQLHYVTAWEVYRCIKILESGDMGDIAAIERFDYSRIA